MGVKETEEVRMLLNEWWVNDDIPVDMLKARQGLIYKNGDTSKFENYSRYLYLTHSTN